MIESVIGVHVVDVGSGWHLDFFTFRKTTLLPPQLSIVRTSLVCPQSEFVDSIAQFST